MTEETMESEAWPMKKAATVASHQSCASSPKWLVAHRLVARLTSRPESMAPNATAEPTRSRCSRVRG